MSASDARPGAGRGPAFGALALAWALYVLYIFLPVTGPADSTMNGAEILAVCFIFMSPLRWPLVLGHLLFWGGSVLLAMRRWRGAAVAGLLSLTVSIVTAVLFRPAYLGMYCNLLAMTVLVFSAIMAGVADAKGPAEPGVGATRGL